MKLSLSETQLRQQIRYFAYYELVSGSLSLVLLIGLAQAERLSGSMGLSYALCLAVPRLAAYSGYRTLKQPYQGLRLSRISLLMQVIGISVAGCAFRFFVAPFVAASLYYTDEFGIKVAAALTDVGIRVNQSDELRVSVNLVAILLFLRTTKWLTEWNYRYNQQPLASSSTLNN